MLDGRAVNQVGVWPAANSEEISLATEAEVRQSACDERGWEGGLEDGVEGDASSEC